MTNNLLGSILALASALTWGSGDFCGGLATRRQHQFVVLAWSALSGILLMAALAWLTTEAWLTTASIWWAVAAGAGGALGIASLYKGLSLNQAAAVAPTAAVVGAALPVVFGIFTQGVPNTLQLAGFAVAFAGIWLVSQSSETGGRTSRDALALALLAGAGFGSFYILISQVQTNAVFTPLIVARSTNFVLALLLLAAIRKRLTSPLTNPMALLAGMLDAGGNAFFLLARQFTRLDIATLLSSFYPAATVVLAWLVLRERVAPRQWGGAALCLAAIALITYG